MTLPIYQVAIIKNTNYYVPKSEWNVDTLTREYIRNNIQNHIEFHTVDTIKSVMNLIHKILNGRDEKVDVLDCSYDNKNIYHIIGVTVGLGNMETPNGLASQISKNNRFLGDSLLIKRNIIGDSLKYDSITLDDITNLVYKNIVKTGVKCNADGSMEEVKYVSMPCESMGMNYIVDNMRYHELKFFDHAIVLWVDTSKEDEELNHTATCIYDTPVKGSVYFSMRENEAGNISFMDITPRFLYNIYCHKLLKRDLEKYRKPLKIEKVNQDDDIDTFPVSTHLPNIYYILDREYNDNPNVDPSDNLEEVVDKATLNSQK